MSGLGGQTIQRVVYVGAWWPDYPEDGAVRETTRITSRTEARVALMNK